MSAADVDRGMRAVERVRGVRERDSRIGLQQAMQEHAAHQQRLDDLHARLDAVPAWEEGESSSFLAVRDSLALLSDAITGATEALGAAARISESARAHWTQDKTRLAAVESLLERRAQARRTERERAEARELDDIAGQLWLRSRGGNR